MQLTVITGMSGSGKTQAVRFFEDMGYFCVDNLPPVMIPKFAEIFFSVNGRYENIAFVIDTRVGEMINELLDNLAILKENGYGYTLLFMDASDEVLVKRYKETRRTHPIKSSKGLLDSIRRERAMLEKLYTEADVVVDTSKMKQTQLSDALREVCFKNTSSKTAFAVNVMSFGFKYGMPLDADLVFDVRCFKNPFYVEELKDLTGEDKPVRDYVMSSPEAVKFYEKLNDMMKFMLPLYIEEGKSALTIAIGCTGGKHRSVTLANALAEALAGEDYTVNTIHRDIGKGR